jgi:hypothetical protein
MSIFDGLPLSCICSLSLTRYPLLPYRQQSNRHGAERMILTNMSAVLAGAGKSSTGQALGQLPRLP